MYSLINSKRFLLIVFGICFFNLFVFNQGGLWDEDEAAYAGIARTMVQTGDFLHQHFTWSTIHRKTPLHFWMIAGSYKVFGINEFAVRFPGALCILLTIVALWGMGRKVLGEPLARASALVLATSLLVPFLAKMALTDGPLLLFETVAALALLNWLTQPRWIWLLAMWGAVSLGLLVKGPPILIFFGGLWIWQAIFHPQRKLLIGTHPWFFLPLAALPLFLWGWMSWQSDNGEFIKWLWDWYVMKRVGGSVLGQSGPPGYHLLVILISFLPWLTFLPSSLVDLVRGAREKSANALFFAGWLVFGWLFYEVMSSKLPTYSIAAHPALAVLIAAQMLAFERKDYKYRNLDKTIAVFYMIITFVAAFAMVVLFLQDKIVSVTHSDVYRKATPVILLLWASGFIGTVGVYAKERFYLAAGGMAACGAGTAFLLGLCVMPIIETTPLHGTKLLAQAVEKVTQPDEMIILALPQVECRKPSLIYYMTQHRTNVNLEVKAEDLTAKFVSDTSRYTVVTDEKTKNDIAYQLGLMNRHFSMETPIVWWDIDHNLRDRKFWILKR